MLLDIIQWMLLNVVGQQHPATPSNTQQHPATPSKSNNIRQNPTTSNNIQQHPTTSNTIQQHPTTSNTVVCTLTFTKHAWTLIGVVALRVMPPQKVFTLCPSQSNSHHKSVKMVISVQKKSSTVSHYHTC